RDLLPSRRRGRAWGFLLEPAGQLRVGLRLSPDVRTGRRRSDDATAHREAERLLAGRDGAGEPRAPGDGVSRVLGGGRRAERREGVEEEHAVAALHVRLQIVGGAAERQARIFPILDRRPVEVEALASTENFHRTSCRAGTEQLWCQLHPVGGPAGKREAGQETLG